MTIRPADTMAVVVGVERYEAGPAWDLSGPALDACKFAHWLADSGVPAGQITLLVSPLQGKNERDVRRAARPFRPGQATKQSVLDALTRNLYRKRSELLVIHWGGHGILGNADAKHLLCADATAEDMRNIDITNMMQALRTDKYPHHPRQLIFVDACQTAADEMGWQNALSKDVYATGQEQHFRDQWAFFAASRGERAINDNRLRSGLFSRVLLEVLGGPSRDVWPPGADEIRELLSERFNELREAGRTRQIPSYVTYRSRSRRDEDTIFAASPARGRVNAQSMGCRLLTYREFGALKAILHGAPAPDSLRSCYLLAARDLIGSPRHPDDLMSCVDTLRGAVSPMPLMEFLVRLAAGSDNVTQERLWAWIEDMAERHPGIDIDELRDLDAELHSTVLLVRVKPDLIEEGDQVTVWTYVAGEGRQAIAPTSPWSRDRLAAELSRLLRSDDPRLAAGAASVEFLVETGMLNDDFEVLPIRADRSDEELGSLYPVMVRPLDRLNNPGHGDQWRDKWKRLTACWDSYEPTAIGWLDRASSADWTGLPEAAEQVCAALTDDRPQATGADTTLEAVLAAGLPVAIWHRDTRLDPRKALEDVLRNRGLRVLPEVVWHQRVAAANPAARPDHAGRGLVLLWDDPTRVPSNMQWEPPAHKGVAS